MLRRLCVLVLVLADERVSALVRPETRLERVAGQLWTEPTVPDGL